MRNCKHLYDEVYRPHCRTGREIVNSLSLRRATAVCVHCRQIQERVETAVGDQRSGSLLYTLADQADVGKEERKGAVRREGKHYRTPGLKTGQLVGAIAVTLFYFLELAEVSHVFPCDREPGSGANKPCVSLKGLTIGNVAGMSNPDSVGLTEACYTFLWEALSLFLKGLGLY